MALVGPSGDVDPQFCGSGHHLRPCGGQLRLCGLLGRHLRLRGLEQTWGATGLSGEVDSHFCGSGLHLRIHGPDHDLGL